MPRPVALVTGASSGFGLLASLGLARAGHRVIATLRDPARAHVIAEAAKAAGVELETHPLDVTSHDSIRAALPVLSEVDVLVNNAGYGLGGFFEDVTEAELRAQFETNFFGLAAVTRAVLPGMRARGRGRIVNVSSISGVVCKPAMGSYAASKWAVEGLSESLRLELLPFGIHVVLIEPGTFKTDIFSRNRVFAKHTSDPKSPYYSRSQKMLALLDRVMEKRAGDPEKAAAVIVHAATPARPRLRYLVGGDAKGQAALKTVLPYKLFEKVVMRITGLDRET
jgi:NAD(P)-dependent dehydrogenase (short-subunit alcohol dehydrogenase family)